MEGAMSLEAFTKVSEATKLLVEQGFTPEAVTGAVELVGRALKVDRALVYENGTGKVPGRCTAPLRHAWSVAPMTGAVRQSFPLQEQAPEWVEMLSRGQPVWDLVRNVPRPMRGFLEDQGVQSVLLLPISVGNVNGQWWGFLRLDDCQAERRWAPAEMAIFKTLTRSLSNALKQDQRREALAQTRLELQAMMLRCAAETR
jgi:GAF domain-containing protein